MRMKGWKEDIKGWQRRMKKDEKGWKRMKKDEKGSKRLKRLKRGPKGWKRVGKNGKRIQENWKGWKGWKRMRAVKGWKKDWKRMTKEEKGYSTSRCWSSTAFSLNASFMSTWTVRGLFGRPKHVRPLGSPLHQLAPSCILHFVDVRDRSATQ